MTALSWWLTVAAVVAGVVLAAHKPQPRVVAAADPYANLPQSPPAMSAPEDQPTVDRLYSTSSNCWQANRWLRVAVPQLLEEQASGAVLHPDALPSQAAAGATDLANCPPGSWVDVGGGRVYTDELLAAGPDALPI